MNKYFKFLFLKSVLILLLTLNQSCAVQKNIDSVSISERQLLVNNSPYLIKGVCYHPVPIGSDKRSFDHLTEDLILMKEAGINTIRVYEPIDDIAVLDKISEAGIKVIMGFGYNQNGFYDMLSGTIMNYIQTYKNHKAILFWELGNEYNYHPEWFENDIKNWYKTLNNTAEQIHKIDLNHLVSTAHGELPDALALASASNVDIWGMNVYRWDNPEGIFKEWQAVSTKPMYLSEAGTDSYMTIQRDEYKEGENEKAQADAIANILDDTFKNKDICAGVTIYGFVDEWWKSGNNNQLDPGGWAPNSSGVPYDGTPNEEYWGILDINRNKKQAFEVVKTIFRNLSKN